MLADILPLGLRLASLDSLFWLRVKLADVEDCSAAVYGLVSAMVVLEWLGLLPSL